MAFQPGSNNYCLSFGTSPENVQVPHIDVRDPTTTDVQYPIGKRWINQTGGTASTLVSQSSVGGVLSSTWLSNGSIGGPLNTLTGGTGGAISPVTNNITLAGTANQIVTTGTAGTITSSLSPTLVAPGTITATTTLTATLGDITATNGNFVKGTAGNKDVYTSLATTTTAGANSAGTVTLVGGTATIATTAVTASSQIRIYRQSIGATGAAATGQLSIGTISAGVSFIINSVLTATATSLATTDVSVIFWEIVN